MPVYVTFCNFIFSYLYSVSILLRTIMRNIAKVAMFYFKCNCYLKLSFQQTFAAWRLVFLLTVVINGVCGLQYIFFCKAEIQWWNTYWKSDSESKEVEKAWLKGKNVSQVRYSVRRNTILSFDLICWQINEALHNFRLDYDTLRTPQIYCIRFMSTDTVVANYRSLF